MPLYNFYCEQCEKSIRKLLKAKEAKADQQCSEGHVLKRESTAPSAQAVETLDNGIMVRKVVRIADAERIYQEYADGDPRLKR
jgi:hypothetical protein